MESAQSRFAHLLQPIRELTRNWDVDVASELNDYLEELDDMCITFDEGKTTLNFAEAALLIQGSVCIYSKKVELLHSLVYQTLEFVNERKKRQNKCTTVSKEDDKDADRLDDDEAEFIELDVNQPENSEMHGPEMLVYMSLLPPEALVPPEVLEKQKLPLISVKGEVTSSLRDFRINRFYPGHQDLILLSHTPAATSFLCDSKMLPPLPQACVAGAVMDAAADEEADATADDFLPLGDDGMELAQEAVQHIHRHQECMLCDPQAPSDIRRIVARQHMAVRREEEAPPLGHMWKQLDPYEPLGGDKPFKLGKCYKVPNGLDDSGQRKRRRVSLALQDFGIWFRGAFDPPERKNKHGPSFADLNYIHLAAMKEKLRRRHREGRREGGVVSDDHLRSFLPPGDGEEPVEGFRQPDQFGGEEDMSDDECRLLDDVPPDFAGEPDVMSADAHRDQQRYEDMVMLRVKQLLGNSQGYVQETALSRRVKEWEDRIRPKLAQQEQRLPFDIHHYGNRIVSALSGVGQRRSFASIVCGLDAEDACRFLLASLQLANDYTVEIDSTGGLEDSVDSMELTLLSTQRATDRFKTLAAFTTST